MESNSETLGKLNLKKLKDTRSHNKTKYKIVMEYYKHHNDTNLNIEKIVDELEAYPIIKYLQQIIKDTNFTKEIDDEEMLKIIHFTDRLIEIGKRDENETQHDDQIEVQSLSNNQMKSLLSVQLEKPNNRPSSWFNVSHLKIFHIIVKIPGAKSKNEKRLGEVITEEVEKILEETTEDIGSADEVTAGFDSAKIKCSNMTDRTKIFNYLKKTKHDWNITIPPLFDPQIKILGVKFDENNSQEWISRLFAKNKWKRVWKCNIKHFYRQGKLFDVIIETDPALREWIEKRHGQIAVGYKKANAIDHFDIKHCRKCTRFGHMASKCTLLSLCPYCGLTNHSYDKCPVKDEKFKWQCPNCKKFGHNAWDNNCERFQERLLHEIEKRNYQYEVIMA